MIEAGISCLVAGFAIGYIYCLWETRHRYETLDRKLECIRRKMRRLQENG